MTCKNLTGDPDIPWWVLRAKKINHEILFKSGSRELDDDDTEDQTQLEASSDGGEESEGGIKGFIGTRESSVMISTSQAPSQASGSILWRQATLGQKHM